MRDKECGRQDEGHEALEGAHRETWRPASDRRRLRARRKEDGKAREGRLENECASLSQHSRIATMIMKGH